MDYIPVEILEKIFSYLSVRDLGVCCKVSFEWKEIINSNSIWSRLSTVEGLHGKPYLKTSSSLFSNPTKSYREVVNCSQRFSKDCHWRSHFKRYKFLENNWRIGNYATLQTGGRSTYYKDGIIVNTIFNSIEIINVNNISNKKHIVVSNPDFRVDQVCMQGDFIIYTQTSYIVCLQIRGNPHETLYNVKVKNTKCYHRNSVLNDGRCLTINLTSRYVIAQDNKRPCKLLLYNLNTGNLEQTVDITIEKTCIKSHCMTTYCDQIYLSYTANNNNFIAQYDPVDKTWLLKFETDMPAIDLTISKHFLCGKISTVVGKNCELHVWPLQTQEEKFVFLADKSLPVILTDDGKIIFCDDVNVYVQGLIPISKGVLDTHKFQLEEKVVNMVSVMNNYLVINNSKSLQLWDWRKPEMLQILLREKVSDIWVDDRTIVFNKFDEVFNGYILTFW